MVTETYNTDILLQTILQGIKDVKGLDIISLNLKRIETAICKYFIICTGSSNTHVNAIELNIRKKVAKELQEKPWHTEGKSSAEWILMDYTDIVIHIFQKEIREFYKLEEFWGDAEVINHSEKEENKTA